MFDFIPQVLKAIRDAITPLLSTDNFKKVFGFFTSWYTYMAGAGLYVVYKLYIALEKAGIIAGFTKTVYGAVGTVYKIADTCFPLIANLEAMRKCIGDS